MKCSQMPENDLVPDERTAQESWKEMHKQREGSYGACVIWRCRGNGVLRNEIFKFLLLNTSQWTHILPALCGGVANTSIYTTWHPHDRRPIIHYAISKQTYVPLLLLRLCSLRPCRPAPRGCRERNAEAQQTREKNHPCRYSRKKNHHHLLGEIMVR